MGKEIIKFRINKIEKQRFHRHKDPIFLKDYMVTLIIIIKLNNYT